MIKLKDLLKEKKNKGLWANIHAKRKRGESPAKPGDEDYPKTLDVEGKIKEDFKNNKWEVYVADEKGREKIVKVAKSKRAGVILYNRLINTDKYHEVGMRVIKEGKLTEAYKPTVTLAKYVGDGNYKPFSQKHFKTEDEANIYIKKMMKKYKLKRQKGFWGNSKTGIEMVTNF